MGNTFGSVRTRFSHSLSALALGLAAWLAVSPAPAGAQGLQDAPAAAAETASPTQALCQPQVVGNRRIPRDSVIARMSSHQGDAFDQNTVERDFNALWNTGYFESVRIERIDTPSCVQLVVYVQEKRTVRTIEYVGLNAVTQSDVQDRFKKAKVGLTAESQFDETRIKRAETVLKDLLAEHGHQFATIRTEVKTIPPASVGITFRIKEGPTVKVGKIEFDGNYNVSDRTLRYAMRNLRPIGIPHSIVLENIFSRTFDASKLDEDTERVRLAYLDRGYMNASTGEAKTNVRDKGGLNPFTLRPSNGKRVDIEIPVDEGQRYRLAGITFSGYKELNNVKAFRAQFPMKDGDWFNATLLHKGMENLRKAYGGNGFINMVGNPIPKRDDANHTVTFNIDIEEGKKFYVSRIEFTGNTITRDKVIRRELVLEEGQVYNSQLWDLSILRLNQLGYFDNLRVEDDTETHQDADAGTVDLLLRLKEKGKNSIGLNGGLSGLQGTFVGLNYETNNFLGLGETLSANANIGDLQRNLTFGFNEPYLRNKPLAVGVEVFTRKLDYNPAKAYSIANAAPNVNEAARSLLTNYNESTTGFTISASQPLKHLWAGRGITRVGITYALSRASVTTFNDNTRNVFQSLAFRSGVAGPSQLSGIITSTFAPSFSYSSTDRPVGPHSGRDLNISMQIAGAGGNVKYIQPIGTFRQYYPMKGLRISPEGRNVLGMRAQLAFVSGFGGQVAPPQNRLYGGGESDIRGFDVRAGSPYTFIPVNVPFSLTNPDGSTIPRDPTNPALGNVTIPLPIYRPVAIGGDTQFTGNLQYQIPIVSTLSFNLFTDFGLTGDLRPSQLRQSVAGASLLSSPLYGCPTIVNGSCFGGKQVPSFSPIQLNTMPGTNFVPRMTVGAEFQVILPVVNAPLRLFYGYNPLRLYKDVPQQLAVDRTTLRSLFPNNDAGLFSYQESLALYGPSYQLREPRKTFRLTVGTTF